jgi:Tfp pilus assembly protein PilF
MKLMAPILLLGLPVLCGACATPSLPLSTRTEANPVAATYNRQGMEHYQQGQWLAAKENFEEAIRADADEAEPEYNLALSLDQLGDHAGATAHFKAAAKLAPTNTAITQSEAYLSHVKPRRSWQDVGTGAYGAYGGRWDY